MTGLQHKTDNMTTNWHMAS